MSTMDSPPGIDLAALRSYLDSELPGLVGGDLRAAVIPGGKSNLTYLLTAGTGRWVLRRPPLGHVLATAHDMGREYRVLRALHGTPVPVPAVLAHCADPAVIGAPFYLMNHVDGAVYRDAAATRGLGRDRSRAVTDDLVDVLARLHAIDPQAVGLADFGRPDGFLHRQVRRWKAQLDASRDTDTPELDRLQESLAATVLPGAPAAIVHGDYRLDNVLVGTGDRVAAVLDWEMATLGDPLTDLGLFLVYWSALARLPGNAVSTAVGPDFPGARYVVSRYAAARPGDLGALRWYVAFGCFKLAVIAQGIHVRHAAGQTVGEGFTGIGDVVRPLAEQGLAALAGRDIAEEF